MFFSVARLRLFIATSFVAPSFVQAHLNSLFTSSVSYCAPPESLLIQQFDVAYIQHNSSVSFNVSAASVLPNVNVTANLLVNVYGMRPLNMTIDLCSLLGGILCPLPTYNFTGADSITLPSSIDVQSFIPSIAYIIPDLEAFAQLTLTEVGTGKVRACVQSTLSNGWSARQKGAEWATGVIALLALFSAIGYSYMNPEALAAVRLLDVMYLFQTIAASGLLGLNYSSVYRAYASNFSWALGLFSMASSSSIQDSINNMRRLTGGNVDNSDAGQAAISLLLASAASLPSVDIKSFLSGTYDIPVANSAISNANIYVGGNVETVTQESSNILEAGIPIYVNVLGIETENAFMTVFLIVFILAAILLAVLGLGYLALLAFSRTSRGQQTAEDAKARYPAFARAWALRTALICVLPVFIFTFYQWTLKDSWLSIFLSVILLLGLLAGILPPVFYVVRSILPTRWSGEEDSSQSHALAPLIASLRTERYYYIIPLLLAIFVKALVIAFGQAHGMAQAIVILVVEFLLLGVTIVLKPHRTRGADVLAVFLAIVRTVCTGLSIAFSESLALKPIPRVAIGIIMAVIFSITVIVMFLNVLWHLGLRRVLRLIPWRRHRGTSTGATVLDIRHILYAGRAAPSSMVISAFPPTVLISDIAFGGHTNSTITYNTNRICLQYTAGQLANSLLEGGTPII
ncbi:hypothetical protein EW026_g2505 [Hermanssonia centrifuga]|uniref:ML-like domain-containing protein n=1 Tax=Hermanssonia centrifuga TaxID=98765 RepID=A0A4S4KNN6_9APHY|nr:hypothetical protein EW026_g2505 [Hermanssonia centrifuga]